MTHDCLAPAAPQVPDLALVGGEPLTELLTSALDVLDSVSCTPAVAGDGTPIRRAMCRL